VFAIDFSLLGDCCMFLQLIFSSDVMPQLVIWDLLYHITGHQCKIWDLRYHITSHQYTCNYCENLSNSEYVLAVDFKLVCADEVIKVIFALQLAGFSHGRIRSWFLALDTWTRTYFQKALIFWVSWFDFQQGIWGSL